MQQLAIMRFTLKQYIGYLMNELSRLRLKKTTKNREAVLKRRSRPFLIYGIKKSPF